MASGGSDMAMLGNDVRRALLVSERPSMEVHSVTLNARIRPIICNGSLRNGR